MPQFVVIARDAKDPGALDRRMEVREEHIRICDEALENRTQIYGAALLDDEGQMCGSVMVFDVDSREALDAHLKKEPYVTNNVWDDIEIISCKTGPSFMRFLSP